MQTTLALSEKQQMRIKQLVRELQIVEAKIGSLEDLRKSFQMSIQAMLATVLEFHDVPESAQYALSNDATSLELVAAPKES